MMSRSLSSLIVIVLAIFHSQSRAEEVVVVDKSSVVTTPNGVIQGTADGVTRGGRKFYQFKGIQYAIVQERFKPAVEVGPWDGTKTATEFGRACKDVRLHGNENCLFLNVYTPKLGSEGGGEGLPVVVYIHGGAFKRQSGAEYGPNYFLDEDVILVTLEYRTGLLGFLATGDEHSPGNYGLKDQVLALKWVQNNINAFGGDKDKVTIMGQDSGAVSVTYHLVSPLSKGLYRSAIAQSGSFLNPWALTRKPLQYAQRAAKEMNCTDTSSSKAIVECLRSAPAEKLACGGFLWRASNKFFDDPVAALGPVIEPVVGDGSTAFLTESPYKLLTSGDIAHVPLLTGFTREEGIISRAAFLLYSNWSAPEARKKLEANWNSEAPVAFYFDEVVPETRQQEVAEKIRDFYFPTGFSLDKTDSLLAPLAQLYSDRLYVTSGLKFLNLYSKVGTTFPYLYSYYKYPSLELADYTLPGFEGKQYEASHGSELEALFSPLFNETRDFEDFNSVSKSVVKLWASFIRDGVPTATYGSQSGFPSVDSTIGLQKFYEVNEDTKLVDNIFAKRVAFWEGLQLDDYTYSK